MSSEGPSISIVITCFNYARYVALAIESVLAQSYQKKEIIVVNDGSSDGSLEVILRYRDRIRLIDQPNLGAATAYNKGFEASTGDLVVFLDADDLLENDALARVAEMWRPTCSKVQYDLTIIDGDGRDLGRKFCNFDSSYDAVRVRDSFQGTGTYRWPVTVGNAYARWFVEQVFPLRTGQFPDGTLNTIAPVYGEVVTIPATLGRYRIHGNNVWSSTGFDFSRLPHRIEHRIKEVRAMQEHAARRGVRAPRSSALDHELAFVNYRLMAKKLGLKYADHEQDTTGTLLGKAWRVLLEERYPLKLSVAHCLWFGALGSSPPPLSRLLISLRFRRHTIGASLRKALLLRTERRPPSIFSPAKIQDE